METKPSGFQGWVENRWYGSPGLLSMLKPLSCVFSQLATRRRDKQTHLAKPFDVPVIVVGNISIGGTGKTPTLIALAKLLNDQHHRVGIVSRGYGRESTGLVVSSECNTPDTSLLGDEAFMIHMATGCDVAVAENRVEAVSALVASKGCDVILSDDGLQHYRMFRDVEIVVVDGQRLLGNRQVLPVGPLREDAERLDDVDWVLLNGFEGDRSTLPKVFDEARPISITPLAFVNIKTQSKVPLSTFNGKSGIHAVAGIGNPDKFFRTLSQLDVDFEAHAFPDHHAFVPKDFEAFGSDVIVMTEKDAVKCQGLVGENAFYLAVEMNLPDAFTEPFINRVDDLVKGDNV